jgi:N-acyl amino acid synthase of PEP-CTERM/exosortase system
MSTARTALHCLVRAVSNGEYVGCTKLVMAPLTEPLYPLPFEKSCRSTLDRTIIDPQALPRQAAGEISRRAVIAKYRRRQRDDGNIEGISDDSFGDEKRPRFPSHRSAFTSASSRLPCNVAWTRCSC